MIRKIAPIISGQSKESGAPASKQSHEKKINWWEKHRSEISNSLLIY